MTYEEQVRYDVERDRNELAMWATGTHAMTLAAVAEMILRLDVNLQIMEL